MPLTQLDYCRDCDTELCNDDPKEYCRECDLSRKAEIFHSDEHEEE